MITTQQEQARQVADLEAAFVSEMLGLESLKLVAAKSAHIEDLQPHVESWLSDWHSYHAKNGHAPLVKAALTVALQEVEPYRVAAAVWTFHHAHQAAPASNETAKPASRNCAACFCSSRSRAAAEKKLCICSGAMSISREAASRSAAPKQAARELSRCRAHPKAKWRRAF